MNVGSLRAKVTVQKPFEVGVLGAFNLSFAV